MSGENDRAADDTGRKAADEASTSDAVTDEAGATESGYRRDDYWRETARDGTEPGEVPEPSQGYAFERPDQRVDDDGEPADGDVENPGPDAEQGNAGGRDDARIVDD